MALTTAQALVATAATNTVPRMPTPKASPLAAFEARTFSAPDDTNAVLRYRYGAPVLPEPGRRYPLVVCLHGAGERGSDNAKQVGYFLPLLKAIKATTPCHVIIPQVPSNQIWATYGWGAKTETMNGAPSATLGLTKQLIDSLAAGGAVDTDRIYITGVSMGGYGTWEAIQRWPDVFAAAIPVCGGGDPAVAGALTGLPIWAWHGEADTIIAVDKTRRMIDAIIAAGGQPKATYLPKCGHFAWGPAYSNAELAPWLLEQRRAAKPSAPGPATSP